MCSPYPCLASPLGYLTPSLPMATLPGHSASLQAYRTCPASSFRCRGGEIRCGMGRQYSSEQAISCSIVVGGHIFPIIVPIVTWWPELPLPWLPPSPFLSPSLTISLHLYLTPRLPPSSLTWRFKPSVRKRRPRLVALAGHAPPPQRQVPWSPRVGCTEH